MASIDVENIDFVVAGLNTMGIHRRTRKCMGVDCEKDSRCAHVKQKEILRNENEGGEGRRNLMREGEISEDRCCLYYKSCWNNARRTHAYT